MLEKINNRLEQAINNLENKNFEELFPLILNDLEYIFIDFYEDKKQLSKAEDFIHGTDFVEKMNIYFIKLAKIYFKKMFNEDINIIKNDEYSLVIACGGYNKKDGNIYYSSFGALLSKKSDLSFLHTCLHEGCHKMQYEMYKTENPLLFNLFMLKELKEELLEQSLQDNNREFYMNNYNIIFSENDAEFFAKNNLYNFIENLLYLYEKTNKNSKIENFLPQIKRLKDAFKTILEKEPFKINIEIIEQLYGNEIITGEYKIEGKQVDKLILMDKYIKSHPELQEQYPILKLLFDGNNIKNYEQIIQERENKKKNLDQTEQMKIDELYEEIINTDPILKITNLLEKNDKNEVQKFINMHPMILEEYKDEIEKLNEKYDEFYNLTK